MSGLEEGTCVLHHRPNVDFQTDQSLKVVGEGLVELLGIRVSRGQHLDRLNV